MSNVEGFQDASTDYGPLTRQQAENIADLAARRAQERIYTEIGRSIVTKLLWTIGAVGAVASAWVSGWFHVGPKP